MAPAAWCLLSLASLLPGVLGQVFVGSNGTATPMTLPAAGKLSKACNATFESHVTCDPTLLDIAYDGYFPTTKDLTQLCTQSCLKSLSKLDALQQRDCSKQDVLSISGESYPATFTVSNLLWTYNYTCRRDLSSGKFCAPVFDAWANGDVPEESCSDCVLGTYQKQLSFPLGYDNDLASSFSSLTSSCSATNYPVISPPPATVPQNTTVTATSTAAGASKSCSSTYTILEGDDCHSISNSQRVSTAKLLYFNNLEAGCTHFPKAGTELCMPHTCDVYTVKEDDTCYGIKVMYNNTFTTSQLISWNVDINRGCDNLEMLVGNQICVSFPGDAHSPSITGDPAAEQTHLPSFPCFKPGGTVDDSCYVTTYPTLPPWTWTPVNTRTNSTGQSTYSKVPVTPIPILSTYAPATNPTPKPYQTGMVSGCTDFYMPQGNDSCIDIASQWRVPIENLYSWNPALSGDCSGLQTGKYICMQRGETTPTGSLSATTTTSRSRATSITRTTSGKPPGPTQTGIPDGCNKWITQKDGKYCQDMANEAGISLDCLYKMNPALNTEKGECQGLWAGEAYCIGVASNMCK